MIGGFAARILLFVAGYILHGPTPGYPVWHVFEGFLLGMLAMYIAIRFYETPQNRPHARAKVRMRSGMQLRVRARRRDEPPVLPAT